ncbi:hypothetical protein ONZ45_g9919 [Pleurotus djamor]|nr:hypothetical protein ONZ45_g9919 [Pleurotus djamor]
MSSPSALPTHPAESEAEAQPLAGAQRGIFVNNLTPPPNFNFWRREDFTVLQNHRLYRPNSDSYVNVNWNVACYIYTTGARPDSTNFEQENGAFYVVMVHSGDVRSTYVRVYQDFELRISPSAGSTVRQLPRFSEQLSGGNWRAMVDYEQNMNMYTNNGNSLETFTVRYASEFQLPNMDQTGDVIGNQAILRMRSIPATEWERAREVNGLTIFRITNRNAFPLRFDLTAWTVKN